MLSVKVTGDGTNGIGLDHISYTDRVTRDSHNDLIGTLVALGIPIVWLPSEAPISIRVNECHSQAITQR